MIRIGDFSKMNKITVKTLRYYDEIGLLKPAYVDEMTGYRYYSTSQLLQLHKILALKQIGFSLNEIIVAVGHATTNDIMIDFLQRKKAEVIHHLAQEKAKLTSIEFYVNTLRQEDVSMSYDIVIKELPEVIVASMRQVIPNYDAYYKFYPEMGKAMEAQKLTCATPAYCFTIYHDGEYRETNIDVEICEAVTQYGQDTDKMKFKKIEAENAACVMHKGTYSTIGRAYGALMQWVEDNGYVISGPPRESYIDGVWNKENPEEWLTEVQIPVNKKA